MPGALPASISAEYLLDAIQRELAVLHTLGIEIPDLFTDLPIPQPIDVQTPDGSTIPVWLVADSVFCIVFDPSSAHFGLVQESGAGERVLIGLYGSLYAAWAAE